MTAVEEPRALIDELRKYAGPYGEGLCTRSANALEAALSERDALILSTGEHITVRSELRERVTALEKVLEKRERTIAARDRRIARLVDALGYARAQGVRFPADDEPQVVLSSLSPKLGEEKR